MTTKNDIDILLDAHDEAREHLHAVAVEIAELAFHGKHADPDLLNRYGVARLGYESTLRDVNESIAIAATVEAV